MARADGLGSQVFETPGLVQADSYLITWVMAWDTHALSVDPAGLFDANTFHPARKVLAGSEHMLGHLPLFAPLYWLSGNPIWAIQLTRLLAVVLCGLSMFALLRSWRLSPVASFVAAYVYALCPARYLTIHALQLIAVFYLPLVVLFWDRVAQRGRWRDALGLAVCFLLQLPYLVLHCLRHGGRGGGVWSGFGCVLLAPGRGCTRWANAGGARCRRTVVHVGVSSLLTTW